MGLSESCVFCQIVAGEAPATIVERWDDAIAFAPLNPVIEGHMLIVPRVHVSNAASAPMVTSATYLAAAKYSRGRGDANLITSIGHSATQTVFHLHVHYIPRRAGDGILLPWSNQVKGEEA